LNKSLKEFLSRNTVAFPFKKISGTGVKFEKMEIRKSSRMKSNVPHDPNQPYLRIMSGSDRDGLKSSI
jgi:hypothetical protein